MLDDLDSPHAELTLDLPDFGRCFSERSPLAMLAVEGSRGVVRHANDAFLRLAGLRRSDLIGRPFARALPEPKANGCSAMLERVYRSGAPESLTEQRHGERSGVYWSYAAWAIQGDGATGDPRPAGVMVQVTDSTETAVFREQSAAMNQSLMLSAIRQHELAESSDALNACLESTIKEKEFFIAILSHELRTPLAPILIAVAMLQQDDRLGPDTRDVMDMIHRNVTLEARLIDDLLDMTRMERGKLSLDRRALDLRTVVDRAVGACEAEFAAGELVPEVDTGGQPLVVDADAGRLQQVLTNLIRNAVKFTPAGGRVRVRAYGGDDACVIEVSDDGAGIDPEFLPLVFRAFEQGDQARTRKVGLGLGLSISKTIVDLHGGTITARSDGRGRGSTFVVRMPRLAGVRPEAAPATRPAAAEAVRPVRPLRILLVEDDADTARIMRRLLTADGHAVELAGDVAAGVAAAAATPFDLLLSDLGLPDGTGWELMRALRGRGSALPGIALSGYGQDQDMLQSRAAGFAAHLVKPLSPRKLRDAIRAAVGG